MPEQVDGTPAASPKRTWRRKLLFATIALVAGLLLVMISDRVAGWLVPPKTASLLFPANSRIEHESCEFQVDVEISPAGIRDQIYAPGDPPESTYRIVAVGDSFTFGWGVPSQNAWPNVLEQLLNQKLQSEPSTFMKEYEVLNFGLPGASPREYEDSAAKAIEHFRPNLLIVGILQADDLIQSCEQQPARIPLSARILDVFIPSFRRMLRESHPPTPMESYRKTFRLSQQYIRSQFTSDQKKRYNALSPQVQQFFEDGLLNPALVQRSVTVPNHCLHTWLGDRGPIRFLPSGLSLGQCVCHRGDLRGDVSLDQSSLFALRRLDYGRLLEEADKAKVAAEERMTYFARTPRRRTPPPKTPRQMVVSEVSCRRSEIREESCWDFCRVRSADRVSLMTESILDSHSGPYDKHQKNHDSHAE